MSGTASGCVQTVGRYALYDAIGAGGTATVHIGRLLGPVGFGRTVAIKRLHPQLARDPELIAMLLDEARLTSRIQHPNVVSTLDIVTAEGELFVVMDYVLGDSLAALCRLAAERGERVPVRVAVSIVCGVLHGLHAAHETTGMHAERLGIVHRDVSPQNVLVGIDGVARLLDFGVAKALGQAHVTRHGVIKGKLAYMAPEHIRGRATHGSDVYAASIVLWETLTGVRLFAGLSEAETTDNALHLEVEPPSAYLRPEETDDALLDAIDDIVMRGLARDSSARYPSAREMAVALEERVRVASPAEVETWVERLAGDRLRERARLVANAERDAATRPPPSEGDPSPIDAAPPPLGPSASSVETPRTARRWLLAGAAIIAACAFVWLGRSAPTRSNEPEIERPGAAATTAAQAAGPRVESRVEPPADDTEPADDAVPSSSAPARAHRRAPVPRAAPPSRTGARAKHCNPPYTVDGSGRKVFKEECLR